jgi:hypothetical protein
MRKQHKMGKADKDGQTDLAKLMEGCSPTLVLEIKLCFLY